MNQLSTVLQNGTTQEEILKNILEQVEPVNFKDLIAKVNKKNINLREREYIVLVIEWLFKQSRLHNAAFGHTHGNNYLYVGTHWEVLEDAKTLRPFLAKFAYKAGIEFTDARFVGFNNSLLAQLSGVAPGIRQVTVRTSINLQNGSFDFAGDCRLREHNAADGFTYVLPFSYHPDANCPIFERYLNKVLPDQGCRDIIAEYIGGIFVPSSALKLEKVLLLYGGGSNGKSVLFDVINALLGACNISSYSLRQLTDGTGYYRAKFSDKLLNYSSEISKDLDATLFKQLASGEPVDARLPYREPFIMHEYGKMMFNCNELPADVEHTNGFFRRFMIVPFNVTISESEQDKTLAQKIITYELAGVFNWVLLGMRRLLKQQAFTESPLVAEQVRQYRIESDSVKLFLQETNYKPSDKKYVLSGPLYQDYRHFCEQSGYRSASEKKFQNRLKDDGVKITRHSLGGLKVYLKQEPFVQEVEVMQPSTEIF